MANCTFFNVISFSMINFFDYVDSIVIQHKTYKNNQTQK